MLLFVPKALAKSEGQWKQAKQVRTGISDKYYLKGSGNAAN
jgi:hypothetical protein